MSDAQSLNGVGLLVAAYVDENAADQTLDSLKQAQSAGQIAFDDAAVVRADANGKVHIKETGDMSTGRGAGIGALIGGVIGIIGGPAGVAVGAAGGAALGGLAAHTDGGFDQKSLEQLGAALRPGSSAIVVTTSQDFVEEVRRQSTQGETLSAAAEISAQVREALELRQDILMAMVITEEGVAAAKVVSSPTALQAFGIVATEDGVAARAVAADASGAVVVDAVATPDAAAADAVAVDDAGADVAAETVVVGDDLTAIKGVGEITAERLNDIDVLTYAQVASWSTDDIDAVATAIEEPADRIRHEDWVGQAKTLAQS